MSEAACPRCDETIRVPDATPPADASARCPWCRETFSFDELENGMPPLLQWVDSDGETIPYSAGTLIGSAAGVAMAGAGATAASVGSSLGVDVAGDAFNDFDVTDEPTSQWQPEAPAESDAGAFDFESSDGDDHAHNGDDAAAMALMDSAAPAAASYDNPLPRPRGGRAKKSASPLKTMIQMVLGGAVAIPLTGAILYGIQYMGWKEFNFGFWPFDGSGGGSNRTAAAPMDISNRPAPKNPPRVLGNGELPEAFGAGDPINSDSDSDNADNDNFVPRSVAEAPTPGTGDELSTENPLDDVPSIAANVPGMEMPEVIDVPDPLDDFPATTPGDVTMMMPTGPGPGPDIDIDIDPAATDPGTADPNTTDPAATDPPEVMPAPEPNFVPPSQALLDSIEQARNLSTDLAEYDGDKKGRGAILKDFYYSLAEVGELGQPSAGAAYKSLIFQLRESKQLDQMASFGSPWVASADLVKKGVFAVGTLGEQDGQPILQLDPYKSQPVSMPLGGWEENQIDPQQWIGKKVVVIAKLEGPNDNRQGTIRYIEGH